MPRPKGSKNKPVTAGVQQTIDTQANIEEEISKVEAQIEATESKLENLKAKLARLEEQQIRQKQEAVLNAIAASGKSLDEILAIINGLSAKEEPAEEPTEEPTEESTDEPEPDTEG